ncbi:MAG: hypothetical protein V4596_05110 [Bdellovibrionota bacterium]
MKKSQTILNVGVTMLTTLGAASVFAENLPVPRAHDIQPMAGNCAIGPFPQTDKAGPYNAHCAVLTDGEKCLAVIKQYMSSEGVLKKVSLGEEEKVAYCLEHFKNEILGEE